jgi:Arc/MetJ-type ribon-helix-helix transcriptional regulator
MTVTLRPEQEQIVGEAIRTGLIENADDVVDAGVEAIRQRLESNGPASAAKGEIQAAADRMLRFGEKYGSSLGGLTIKDLVNEGRR